MTGGPCGNANSPRVYLAAPIFSPEQLVAVDAVGEALEACGYVTYSPHRDGVMLAPTDPPERRDEVFFSNVRAIRQSDLLVCLLDSRDTGTIWELGCATGFSLPIVAVTLTVPKMNVMLERGVVAHARSLEDLEDIADQLRPHLLYGLKMTMDLRAEWEDLLVTLKERFSYSGETQ